MHRTCTRIVSTVLLALAGASLAGCQNIQNIIPTQTYGDDKYRPKMLAKLPLACNTPDGMRLNPKTGDMYFSCPNFNQKEYPGLVMKITPDNKVVKVCDAPKHPETGYGCPMGMDFGPDGNLYYADNQYFYNKDHKSRVMRIRFKDDQVVAVEVAVEGFKLSNAVMFRGNDMFVTDTFFDIPDKPGVSGVYRIPLDEMNKGIVKLNPKGTPDKHLAVSYQTAVLERRKGETAGADGMTFDAQGNLYVGNFGDGVISKTTFNPDGSINSTTIFAKDWETMSCCDGMFYDKKRNCIFVADSERNAIQRISMHDGKITTLWRNDDTDGNDGLLNQPCEPAIRGDEMIIANFDMPFPGLLNKKYDGNPTLSVIKLD